jgi:patatin-related protein
MKNDAAHRDVELRLALVCYGGVSLAVYMHGVTKELHKLIRASRRFDKVTDLATANPFEDNEGSDSEYWYFEALRELAQRGRRVSVTIDIIAGTSAGGINGVILGKALARNASEDSLKQLWISEGDLKKLLRAPPIGDVKIRAVLAAARLLVRLRKPTSPLLGERMSRLLADLLAGMDAPAESGPESGESNASLTLLPPLGTLDLFVTATDLHGFEVLVPTGAGGASQRDRAYAQLLEFHATDGDTSQFGATATPALAFAARATSSFPGAFAPVSINSFGREVAANGPPISVAGIADHLRYHYNEDGVREMDSWFVDGGVLDNAPFDLVVDAISRKRAESEVLRRVIYIQPDPGRPLGSPDRERADHSEPPGWLEGVWTTVADVKGSHAILRDLEHFREMNIRIAEVGAIAAGQMNQVNSKIDEVLRHVVNMSAAARDAWAIDRWAIESVKDEMVQANGAFLGAEFPTYNRLKALAAGRRLASEIADRFVIPPDSSQSSFVRAAIGAWARSRVEWTNPDQEKLLEMLGPVDVPYRERRLFFLLQGLNGFYRQISIGDPAPARADLDMLKTRAWDMLEHLRDVPRKAVYGVNQDVVGFLDTAALGKALLRDPQEFAEEHAEDFARLFTTYRETLKGLLGDGSIPLWEAYQEVTAGWDLKFRKELLSRYLGFPFWDGLIFPTVALSELPQFTPIGVSQCSPLSATALTTPPGGKLKGVTLHHFGAFLRSEWRENDYLWGRLDGAEIMLRTLQASLTGQAGADARPRDNAEAIQMAGGGICREVLRAILDSETDLRQVADLRESLIRELRNKPHIRGGSAVLDVVPTTSVHGGP